MDDIYISLSRACLHSYGGHFSDRLGAWAESDVGNMRAGLRIKFPVASLSVLRIDETCSWSGQQLSEGLAS